MRQRIENEPASDRNTRSGADRGRGAGPSFGCAFGKLRCRTYQFDSHPIAGNRLPRRELAPGRGIALAISNRFDFPRDEVGS